MIGPVESLTGLWHLFCRESARSSCLNTHMILYQGQNVALAKKLATQAKEHKGDTPLDNCNFHESSSNMHSQGIASQVTASSYSLLTADCISSAYSVTVSIMCAPAGNSHSLQNFCKRHTINTNVPFLLPRHLLTEKFLASPCCNDHGMVSH